VAATRRYNDHHFHFGYFLYACAALVRLDPAFIAANPARRAAMLALARDVVNPPPGSSGHSPHFPTARHKDLFDGHSWASGLFPMSNGKSQESVSEASHCYYAAALLADALQRDPSNPTASGGDSVAGLGAFASAMLSLEHASARRYWQLPPSGSAYGPPYGASAGAVGGVGVYPASFVGANRMAGVVGGLDVVARTWFGTDIE